MVSPLSCRPVYGVGLHAEQFFVRNCPRFETLLLRLHEDFLTPFPDFGRLAWNSPAQEKVFLVGGASGIGIIPLSPDFVPLPIHMFLTEWSFSGQGATP